MSDETARIVVRRAWATAGLLLVVIAGIAAIYNAQARRAPEVERLAYAGVISAIVVAAASSAFLLFAARFLDEDWLWTNLAVALCAVYLLAAGPAWDEEVKGWRP